MLQLFEDNMAYQNEKVKTVIQVLHDGERGFADIGEHLKDAQLKSYFIQEGQTRGSFARELEAEYGTVDGDANDIGGTAAGTLHRVWGDLKAKLGGTDHTLLETAEQGEDVAKKAYADALQQELPLPLHQLLSEQQAHVLTSHDYVRDHRDALASK